MPLPELGGALGVRRAAHLLRRATFGATKQQIDAFASLTPAQAVDQLFRQTLPDPPIPIDPATGNEWVLSGTTDANSDEGDLEKYFLGWFIGQMLSNGVPSNLSLAYAAREKLVLFLHTHFTTIRSVVGSSRALYFQNQLFRLFALDALNPDPLVNIKQLTVKLSVDNAMLRLLDGNQNVKGSVNENYARELLELYTIGRGLEGTLPPVPEQGDYILFKEEDVRQAARVLTGWDFDDTFSTIDPDTQLPRGKIKGSTNNASSHDNGEKVFTERFTNNVIAPDPLLLNGTLPTEESALDEIAQLIDQIYNQPATPKNICWKIYRFFVWAPHGPDRSVPIDSAIISEMANTLIANNYKIQPVIENLLRSIHFYEAVAGDVKDDNIGGIIKSPLDLILGTLRAFDIQIPDMTTDLEGFYQATGEILGGMENLQMRFYEPFDVAGYEAYHQFPIYHRFWIMPNSLARRYEFVRGVVTNAEPGMFKVNVYDYVNNNFSGVAADAKQLILAVAQYLLPVHQNLTFDDASDDGTGNAASGLTAKRLNYFLERFLQQFDEAYWTTRWNEGAGDLREQLEFLFNAMLQSPEYQLS